MQTFTLIKRENMKILHLRIKKNKLSCRFKGMPQTLRKRLHVAILRINLFIR